jgi:DNA-binding Xre family transcriptional regulator
MIRNHLSRELGAQRLSQRELIRRTGLSHQTVADLYHDRRGRIDLATLDRLCAALGVGVGALLEYCPDAAASGTAG